MAALVLPFFVSAQERESEMKLAKYAFMVDSLISTNNYSLYAVTMREMDSGLRRRVFDDFYYLTVEDDSVVAHLPLECTEARKCKQINLESAEIESYHAIRNDVGWMIYFDVEHDSKLYEFVIEVPVTIEELTFTESCDGSAVRFTASFDPPKGE